MQIEIEEKNIIDFLATKNDIAKLEIKIAKLDVKIADLKTELKEDNAKLKADILKWIITIIIAQTALLLTILK